MSPSSKVSEHRFEVVRNEPIAEATWLLELASPVAALLAPGQFMNFAVPGNRAELLRVPLSFARADAGAGTVQVEYALVGEGTRRLSQMKAGDEGVLTGPCGNGWRLPELPGRMLVVAGGIGLPPVVAGAEMLVDAGYDFDAVVGARSSSRLIDAELECLRSLPASSGERRVVGIATDDGSAGFHGFTTDVMRGLLAERAYVGVYTCGPNVMMAGVARMAAEANVASQASLERMMGCGFGACSCCNVAMVSGGYKLCCLDGPVFDAREVAW